MTTMAQDPKKLIRVMVVDDAPIVRDALTAAINSDPQIRVVGSAANGREAVQMVPTLKPDLITMDIHMPEMDGFEATKQIMAFFPTPILIVSSTVFFSGSEMVFKTMTYGALDIIDKTPFKINGGTEKNSLEINERIKSLSRVKVITHPLGKLEARSHRHAPAIVSSISSGERIVAIASSTGGPQSLVEILGALPKDIPCGVVIVQHISEGFDKGLAEWLDAECDLKVKLGEDRELIKPGIAYVAPTGRHMRVGECGRIQLTDEPPCQGQKPAGTILFDSVAKVYGDRAVAVILTGMGRDGADGLLKIRAAGGHVIAQDEASCVVYGMPKAAMELGVVDSVRPLDKIASAILMALKVAARKEVAR
jgi:two-component system chemotaxis response regulator CheB